EQVRFAPQAGKYKVYIVDEVHMLSSAAFNAFLKTLEEPPPFAIFILATMEKHKIIPTILSRCQIFDFKRITNDDTVEHLQEICEKEHIKADKTALHIIAQKSEGCLRDALSILDKIVSFTNGTITYSNTLEHLNILDEDYYFKLVDAMQNQNAGDAILLFDEINRKGFEGDLVLNGFSEFLRNLLVSKDPKVAVLLEVSEGFKQRYLEAASKINDSWLLSALNILNESEINYRLAKNKRLHVELTFIKLSYLSQALNLVNENGQLSKKKQLESIRPVSFKSISPIAVNIQKKEESKPAPTKIKKQVGASNNEAKLVIEKNAEPINSQKLQSEPQDISAKLPKTKFTKLRSLEKIREKVAEDNRNNHVIELNEEELYIAWGKYIDKLMETNKKPIVSNFKTAKLNIVDENCIEIVTQTSLQQKFIEAERGELITHLQSHFNNRSLFYKLEVEATEDKNTLKEEVLSTKQQYLRIIELYPLVKQLKDKLGMQLDY
ncbi:MAG TPA: DNA polymerase III subunit gamma/tau, partial [Hanamia sp.]|nr:DNA polymerase III subunit gamma/tau [Hanamia sp.]